MRSTFAVAISFAAVVFLNSPALAAASPALGVNVSLDQVPGNRIAAVMTDARGVARFPNVSPGRYRITAQYLPPKGPQTQTSNLNLSKSNINRIGGEAPGSVAVDLSPGKSYISEFTVSPGAPQLITIIVAMETSGARPTGPVPPAN